MRHIFRCLTAAIMAFTITACSVGEGNGIVSIRIVALDGSTDFELRSDQCEGLLLGVIATFTDGQQLFYSSRSSFELVSGNGTVEELKNNAGFTTAAELVPTANAAPGDKVVVRATYLSLEAEQEFTYNDVTIDSFQVEPVRVALIAGESQNLSPVLTLSDGSRVTGLARALEFTLDDEDEFTLGGFTSTGQQILNTTSTNGNSVATATYCGRTTGKERSDTIELVNHTGNDATLEIRSNFDGSGLTAAGDNAVELSNGVSATVSAHLLLPNDVERNVTLLATWSSSDSDDADCTAETASCSARNSLAGAIFTDESNTGETNISASYETTDGVTIDAAKPLKLNISPIQYQTPAFVLKDEANQPIDTSVSGPVVSMASGTGRILKFVAQLENASNVAYEQVVNAIFVSADDEKIISNNTTLAATGDVADDNVQITVNTDSVPGAQSGAFTNNIPSFQAEVHLDNPTGLVIDADSDNAGDSALTAAIGDKIQLRAILQFAKGDIVRTGATTWSSSNPDAVVVTNVANSGQITVLTTDQTIITAKHLFTAQDGTETFNTATITIN